MTFDDSQYREVLERLERARQDAEQLFARIDSKAAAAFRIIDGLELVPGTADALRAGVRAAAGTLRNVLSQSITAYDDVIVGAQAPLLVKDLGREWARFRSPVTDVVGALENPQTRLGADWEGRAAGTYFPIVETQVKALNRIDTMADKTSLALADMATAGANFYGAVLIAATVFVGALVAAVSLLAIPVGGVGLAIAAGLAAFVAYCAALAAAAATFIGWQNRSATILQTEIGSHAALPGGSWPKPRTSGITFAAPGDAD